MEQSRRSSSLDSIKISKSSRLPWSSVMEQYISHTKTKKKRKRHSYLLKLGRCTFYNAIFVKNISHVLVRKSKDINRIIHKALKINFCKGKHFLVHKLIDPLLSRLHFSLLEDAVRVAPIKVDLSLLSFSSCVISFPAP